VLLFLRRLAVLPRLHRDPFDRLLICQCIEGSLRLITQDEAIRSYSGILKCLW